MNAAFHGFDAASLPGEIAVFPLPGALLLPRGCLPLNVFEPRYLNMVDDVLGGDRLIGLVQPIQGEADPVSDTAALYRIGCLGRIVSFEATEDGRMVISLAGICRFNIGRELDMARGYRRVAADYGPFRGDLEEDTGAADVPRLLDAVRAFFELKEIEADWRIFFEAPDDALVTSLSMFCPLEGREKQALLECPGLAERGEMLSALMEMAVHKDAGYAVAALN